MINRRKLLADLLPAAALAFLLAPPASAEAAKDAAARAFRDWLSRSDELAGLLRGAALTDAEWRSGLTRLQSEVSLNDVLAAIDFESLLRTTGYAEAGVATAKLKLPDGTSRPVNFFLKLFALGEGRAIIPHGHANMVSAHMILSGEMRLRQYDQIARDASAMRFRPAIDRTARPGEICSIGEFEENVHWFVAHQPSHTLDLIVTGLDEGETPAFDIFNLDMDAAIAAGNGELDVPILGVEQALAKYG